MNTNAREAQKAKKKISEKSQTTASTTRRRTRGNIAPITNIMEKHDVPIEIRFD